MNILKVKFVDHTLFISLYVDDIMLFSPDLGRNIQKMHLVYLEGNAFPLDTGETTSLYHDLTAVIRDDGRMLIKMFLTRVFYECEYLQTILQRLQERFFLQS